MVFKDATKNIILWQIIWGFRKNASLKESKAEQYKKDYKNSPISRSKWTSFSPHFLPRESPQSSLRPHPPNLTYGQRKNVRLSIRASEYKAHMYGICVRHKDDWNLSVLIIKGQVLGAGFTNGSLKHQQFTAPSFILLLKHVLSICYISGTVSGIINSFYPHSLFKLQRM